MKRVASPDDVQTVSHEELVIRCREQCSRDVDQDRDPAVVLVAEGFSTVEDGCDNAGAEVTSQVRADRDVGEAPDHESVSEADDEWSTGGSNEGVGGIESSPDDDADVAVHEPLDEEEVAQVVLRGTRERAEHTRRTTIVDIAKSSSHRGFGEGGKLLPVHSHEQQASHERAKDLCEDVVRYFLPGETLPDSEADGYGRVEVATRSGGTSDDGEGNAKSECEAD